MGGTQFSDKPIYKKPLSPSVVFPIFACRMNPCRAIDWHKRFSIIPYHVPTRLILEFHISNASQRRKRFYTSLNR